MRAVCFQCPVRPLLYCFLFEQTNDDDDDDDKFLYSEESVLFTYDTVHILAIADTLHYPAIELNNIQLKKLAKMGTPGGEQQHTLCGSDRPVL